jgi:hypothetical protein
MADDTFASRNIGHVLAGGQSQLTNHVIVAASETIYPCYAIYISQGKAYAANSTDAKFSGVAGLKPDQDIDTAYTAGEMIPYFPKGEDVDVWMYLQATTPSEAAAIDEGLPAKLGTEDGKVSLDVAIDGSTSQYQVGHFKSYSAGSATNDILVKVNLSRAF